MKYSLLIEHSIIFNITWMNVTCIFSPLQEMSIMSCSASSSASLEFFNSLDNFTPNFSKCLPMSLKVCIPLKAIMGILASLACCFFSSSRLCCWLLLNESTYKSYWLRLEGIPSLGETGVNSTFTVMFLEVFLLLDYFGGYINSSSTFS